jgi:hypothetical protein
MLGPSMMFLATPLAFGYAVHAWRASGGAVGALAALALTGLETLAVLVLLVFAYRQ